MEDLTKLSSSQISNIIDEKEKLFSSLLKEYQIVEQAKLLLQREILGLQIKKKDLEISLSKQAHNIKQVVIEIKLLKSSFWNGKDSR